MNLESQPSGTGPEEKPQKSKAVDLLQAFGCGLLILAGMICMGRLIPILVTLPPLSWIPSGKSGPAWGFLHHSATSYSLFWLIPIAYVSLSLKWGRGSKNAAMGPEERAKARRQNGKKALIAAPFVLALMWLFEGFDMLKATLAFLIVFILVIGVAVAISRWRRKKNTDEPPGVKVI